MSSVILTLDPQCVKFSMSSREENLINQLQNHIKILEHEVEKQKKENENLLNLIRLMQDTHPSSKKFEL